MKEPLYCSRQFRSKNNNKYKEQIRLLYKISTSGFTYIKTKKERCRDILFEQIHLCFCSMFTDSPPAVGMCSFSQRETIRQDGPISVLRVYYAIYPFVVLISAFFKREKQKDIFSKGFKEKELLYQIQLIPSCPKDLLEPGEKRIVQPVGL